MGDLSAKKFELQPTHIGTLLIRLQWAIHVSHHFVVSWKRITFSISSYKALYPTQLPQTFFFFLFLEPSELTTRLSLSTCVLTSTYWSESAWKSTLPSIALEEVSKAMPPVPCKVSFPLTISSHLSKLSNAKCMLLTRFKPGRHQEILGKWCCKGIRKNVSGSSISLYLKGIPTKLGSMRHSVEFSGSPGEKGPEAPAILSL